MKKLLLTLGAIASVAAPVAAVVACGTTPAKTDSDALAKALATTKATDKAEVEGSLLNAEAKKAAEGKIDAAKDLQELTDVNSLLEVQEATAKSKDEAAKAAKAAEAAAAAKAPQYKDEVAKLQKENTEKFAGKDITWDKTVDLKMPKDGDVFDVEFNGVKQLIGIVSGQWKATADKVNYPSGWMLDTTAPGIALVTPDKTQAVIGMNGTISVSGTTITMTVKGTPPPYGYGDEVSIFEVKRIGSVK